MSTFYKPIRTVKPNTFSIKGI